MTELGADHVQRVVFNCAVLHTLLSAFLDTLQSETTRGPCGDYTIEYRMQVCPAEQIGDCPAQCTLCS
eukprot:1194970-Amphidinium_carterae.1